MELGHSYFTWGELLDIFDSFVVNIVPVIDKWLAKVKACFFSYKIAI